MNKYQVFEDQVNDVILVLNNGLERELENESEHKLKCRLQRELEYKLEQEFECKLGSVSEYELCSSEFYNTSMLVFKSMYTHQRNNYSIDAIKWFVEVVFKFDEISLNDFVMLSYKNGNVTRESVLKVYKSILNSEANEINDAYALNK
jgi:hypothetical protein